MTEDIVPARWCHLLTLIAAAVAVAIAYVEFAYGVLGAVLIGWMAMVIALVRGPLRRGEPIAWTMLATSTSIWFVIDPAFSLAMGFWQNAVLNRFAISPSTCLSVNC